MHLEKSFAAKILIGFVDVDMLVVHEAVGHSQMPEVRHDRTDQQHTNYHGLQPRPRQRRRALGVQRADFPGHASSKHDASAARKSFALVEKISFTGMLRKSAV